jgi:hypothetical protein
LNDFLVGFGLGDDLVEEEPAWVNSVPKRSFRVSMISER